MQKKASGRRWVFVLILFFFLVFHQLDINLLDRMDTQIRETLRASNIWLDPFFPLGLIITIVAFIVWGYLFDRQSRRVLISLSSLLWGISSWLMAISPTSGTFIVSNVLGGADNASYSGIYSLVGDHFGPRNRGKILGLFHLTQPLAFFLSILISNVNDGGIFWRWLFLFSGGIGILFVFLIYSSIKDPKRGASEPALAKIKLMGVYQLDRELAFEEMKRPSLLLIFAIGLFGIMPWSVLIAYIFPFLRDSCNCQVGVIYMDLIPALIAIALGYPLGGLFGDMIFRFKRNGRIWISLLGTLIPPICLYFAFQRAGSHDLQFGAMIIGMSFFLAFVWPNVLATIMDISLPEVRSTAISVVLLLQALGALIGPMLVSRIQGFTGLGNAILFVCIGGWGMCFLMHLVLMVTLPKDIEALRQHLAYRSQLEARLERQQGTTTPQKS
jgi:MFS family permease